MSNMNGQSNKPAFRSEIEKALDDLISNEGGMKFQGLATVLAKKLWPGIIACERKNDLGLDAYLSPSIASDGIGKGLACSITAEFNKISGDAKKIRQDFPDVSVLWFSTPGKVSNPKKKEWVKKIKESFGFELLVSSREDLIISLMLPENTSLCRSFLGIDVSIDPPINEVIERVRKAAAAFSNPFPARNDEAFIELLASEVGDDNKDSSNVFSLNDLQRLLSESRRIVLEAPAGSGKTTTLVQLSKKFTQANGIAFFIDVPVWVSSGLRLLEFITGSPVFLENGIDAKALLQVRGAEKFVFLLNGWNEIHDSQSTDVGNFLRELERAFPEAGIIVATRPHHIYPPLPLALRIKLFPLSHSQRHVYLMTRLGKKAGDLYTRMYKIGIHLTKPSFEG